MLNFGAAIQMQWQVSSLIVEQSTMFPVEFLIGDHITLLLILFVLTLVAPLICIPQKDSLTMPCGLIPDQHFIVSLTDSEL